MEGSSEDRTTHHLQRLSSDLLTSESGEPKGAHAIEGRPRINPAERYTSASAMMEG